MYVQFSGNYFSIFFNCSPCAQVPSVVTSPANGDGIKPDDLQNIGGGPWRCTFCRCAMHSMSTMSHQAKTAGFHVAKRSASQNWKDSEV